MPRATWPSADDDHVAEQDQSPVAAGDPECGRADDGRRGDQHDARRIRRARTPPSQRTRSTGVASTGSAVPCASSWRARQTVCTAQHAARMPSI